ncbi:Cytochrome P450 81E8 [Bienertia sinuspersici]
MDQIWVYTLSLVLISIFSCIFIIFVLKMYQKTEQKQSINPPSPPHFPVIGHLHLLKQPLHRFLQELSYKYGPIYSLKFGFRPVIVISSPTIVEECFTKHDLILANRPRLLVGKHLHYDWTTLGAASYGPLWRKLRRVTTLEFFSNTKLNSTVDIRGEEMNLLVKGLFGIGKRDFVKVEMRPKFSELAFNVVMRMVTGKRYFGDEVEGVEEAKLFRGIVRDVSELSGAANPVDFFPSLRWFGVGKIEKKMLVVRGKMDDFLNCMIEECKRNKMDDMVNALTKKAMIYKLLDMQEKDPQNYSDEIIKGIIMIMLTAGTDTTSVTMEWALSLLLNHPKVLNKARLEIDNYVQNHRLLNESDIPYLPYIQNIVSETLRLFPAVPLLSPHEPSEDCTIAGYHVQRGTMVLINAWAIHRDTHLWDEPSRFRPERFEDMKIDDSRLVPFGLGRRSCPGAKLANRMVVLALGLLIQCFEWEKVGQKDVDLDEGFGLGMPKATPLEVMCRVRDSMDSVSITYK